MRKFVDFDPFTGIKETFTSDGDKIRIVQEQDVKPFLEANKRDRDIRSGTWKGTWHKARSIPPILVEIWIRELREMGADNTWPFAKENEKFFMAKMNDSEYAQLRTKDGKI